MSKKTTVTAIWTIQTFNRKYILAAKYDYVCCWLLTVYLNDAKHWNKDIMYTQLLQSMYLCISDDHKTVVMIRIVTRKTDKNRGYQFKILKVYPFIILIRLNVIGFIIWTGWKNKCLSICYSKSYFNFFQEIKHYGHIQIFW